MRTAALLLVASIVASCGTTSSTKLDIRPTGVVSFDFRDERPAEQRLTRKSRVSYGEMTLLGDDGISPEPPALFRTWLEKALSKELAGRVVALREFSVQIIAPDAVVDEQGFSTAAGATPGANAVATMLARALVGGVGSAGSEKMVSVRIGGRVADREFSARWGGSFKGRITEEDVNSVIVQALDAMVKEVATVITAR